MRPPAQVLSDLFDALATLMAEVNPTDQDAHNAEIAKVKDQITQAKADFSSGGYQDSRGAGRFGCTSLPDYSGSECIERSPEEEAPISPAAGL